MSLPGLRTLINHDSAPAYNGAATHVFYAEDWNLLKKTIEQGQYGIYTDSVQISSASLTSGKKLDVTGNSLFTGNVDIVGDLDLSGATSDLTVDGLSSLSATTVSSTLTVSGATTLSSAVTITTGGLTVTAGGLAVTAGNISTGGGTAIDVSAHDHSGGSMGAELDGSVAIGDGTITYAKIDAASLGLTVSTLAKGDDLADTRLAINNLVGTGGIYNGIMAFNGTSSAGVVYPVTTTSQLKLIKANSTSATPGPGSIQFLTADTGNDAAFTTFSVPGNLNLTSGVAVVFYFLVKTAPAGATKIKLKGFVSSITQGSETTDVDYSAATINATTTLDNTTVANRVLTLSVVLTSTNYANADWIVAGIRRIDPTPDTDAAESVYLLGAKLQYNLDF